MNKAVCFSQVLPPLLGAEWSVLQCDDLCWPGAHAQVSSNGAQMKGFGFCSWKHQKATEL